MKLSHETRRSNFLQDASVLLLHKSPAASSFLGAKHLEATPRPTDSNVAGHASIEHCNSCGTVLIPSWTTRRRAETTKTGSLKPRGKGRPTKSQDSATHKVARRCTRCDARQPPRYPRPVRNASLSAKRELRQKRPQPRLTIAQPIARKPVDNVKAGLSDPNPPSTPSSTPSKQRRAKASKALGLQARLAREKATAAPATFDLMDFMQSG